MPQSKNRKNAKADFVAVTGDMVYPMPLLNQGTRNNLKSSKMFASLMERLGVDWTVVFGNHDSEVWAKLNKEQLGDFMRRNRIATSKGRSEYLRSGQLLHTSSQRGRLAQHGTYVCGQQRISYVELL